MAHKMVCEYGMSENLGLLTYGKKDEQIFLGRDLVKEKNYSEEVAAKIDMEVRRVVDECHEKTKKLILENKENLIKIAEILMEEEILSGEDIDQILKGTYQKKRDRKEKEDTEKDNEKESSTEENSPEKEVKKDQD
jgi:cell division protease FtsH